MGPYMLCACNGIISEASDHKCESCGRTVEEAMAALTQEVTVRQAESRIYGNLAKIFSKALCKKEVKDAGRNG